MSAMCKFVQALALLALFAVALSDSANGDVCNYIRSDYGACPGPYPVCGGTDKTMCALYLKGSVVASDNFYKTGTVLERNVNSVPNTLCYTQYSCKWQAQPPACIIDDLSTAQPFYSVSYDTYVCE